MDDLGGALAVFRRQTPDFGTLIAELTYHLSAYDAFEQGDQPWTAENF
jgi:hypothetical protein